MTMPAQFVWGCVFASACVAMGCKKQMDAPADQAQPSATESSKPVADAPPPPASGQQPHCADFFTDAEVSALALKPLKINHELTVSSQLAVRCAYEGVWANIWRGDQFPSIVEGVKTNGANSGVEIEEGPSIGAQSLWTTMRDVHGADGKPPHTVNFSPPNKKFTGGVTGTDRAKVQQVATALLARFEKL